MTNSNILKVLFSRPETSNQIQLVTNCATQRKIPNSFIAQYTQHAINYPISRDREIQSTLLTDTTDKLKTQWVIYFL